MFSIFSKCFHCEEKLNNKIKAEVKRPGFIGLHSKKFCSENCIEEYKEFISKYEEENGKISMHTNGGMCLSCYD